MKDQAFGFLKKYRYHFLVWSLFIIYEIAVLKAYSGRSPTIADLIFAYLLSISLFYFHANVLLKYAMNTQNKVFKYSLVLLVLLEIIIYYLIRFVGVEFIRYMKIPSMEANQPNRHLIIGKIWKAIYYIGNSTGYFFLMRDLQQRQHLEKMKQQELRQIIWEKEVKNELILTQNAFLRAQINPHFLINTLSYLYNETRKLAPKAADSILSLSDIMQYALSKEVSSGNVKLENEIKLVENFLILHQVRQIYQMQLQFLYDKKTLPVLFTPLVLMSLTENMIKHGELNNPLKPAMIKITYDDSILCIKTSNYKSAKTHPSDHYTDLKNIKSRMSITYGERLVFDSFLDLQNYFHTHIQVRF
ncbi:histidine kinase [Pedobacter sp. PAMC26386]|nr:histidine kinase [Pedobacter sp. PAMC26386]